MEWLGFVGSIFGGLIGGLFTFIGVKMTIKHEKEKEIREQLQKAELEKPRLEIVSFNDFEATKDDKETNNDCNVLILKITDYKIENDLVRIIYNEDALDREKLVYVEYEFMNTGHTEIIDISVANNYHRNYSIVELERKDFYINNRLLNYGVWSNKRYIKPGQTCKIRIYYVDEEVICSELGMPILTIWLRDVNERYWSQSLLCPYNQIEISHNRKFSDFRKNIDVDTAIECFKKPYLW